MGRAYYNEIDRSAAAWLRELISAGLIADGDVDERSIVDVEPDDLAGYTQCHFFAGIGGWSYALRLAGWSDDWPVWTGSCPCQPFSSAGKGKGTDDERHLWPEFARLIGECKPSTVFGEQVASKAGREWFDGVSTDLEGMGYAAAAADLCAASVDSPHIRQRIYWVGHAISKGLEGHGGHVTKGRGEEATGSDTKTGGGGDRPASVDAVHVLRRVPLHDMWDTRSRLRLSADRRVDAESIRPWQQFDALPCSDGWRRVRPGSFPLAHGIPGRVGRLRGYGNAIVPQVAAEFVGAFLND